MTGVEWCGGARMGDVKLSELRGEISFYSRKIWAPEDMLCII